MRKAARGRGCILDRDGVRRLGAGEVEEGRTRRQVGARLSTYYLSADDEIRISVYGYGELDRTLRIPPDGHIYYPALGEIDVDG
jgi:hypothetical protein